MTHDEASEAEEEEEESAVRNSGRGGFGPGAVEASAIATPLPVTPAVYHPVVVAGCGSSRGIVADAR